MEQLSGQTYNHDMDPDRKSRSRSRSRRRRRRRRRRRIRRRGKMLIGKGKATLLLDIHYGIIHWWTPYVPPSGDPYAILFD